MQLKTILNHVQKHSSFVYGEMRLREGDVPELEVAVRPRSNGRPECSGCGRRGPGYDQLPQRRFEFVPLWGIRVFFLYAMRRVACSRCGIRVERIPWAEGKSPITTAYAWFLADWARQLSWQEVAARFRTRWHTVYRAVRQAVAWGLAHRDLEGIEAIGVDEVLWQRGPRFLTVVYQIDAGCRRLLWIGRGHNAETLEAFFDFFGERAQRLRFVCSDMWRPYRDVLARRASEALHVFDRYHVVARMNFVLDRIRAGEARRMKKEGYEPVLAHSRWCLLKRPSRLTSTQRDRLEDLLQYNLKTIRAYLLKEEFQLLWDYVSPAWAGKFLDRWCTKVLRSRIDRFKPIARGFRKNRELILNWFRARGTISAGAVEGLNNKLKLTTRKAYGYRSFKVIEIALYHALGHLPQPAFTHKFC
jgi:transposase